MKPDVDVIRARWLDALGSTNPDVLDRRLLWDGYRPDQLIAAAEDILVGHGRFEPSMTRNRTEAALEPVLDAIKASAGRPLQPPPASDEAGWPFAELWSPPVEAAVDALRARLRPVFDLARSAPVLDEMANALGARLSAVGAEALWALFQADRGLGAVLVDQLGVLADDGIIPERVLYGAFIERHRRDGLESLFRTFPVLERLLGSEVASWLDGGLEMLARIQADRDLLSSVFDLPAAAPLCMARQDAGDRHNGGRSVAILRFNDRGEVRTIVYKPRDLGLDAQYQRALADLNRASDRAPLMTARILPRPGYGYMEWVDHRPCGDRAALRRFYYNAGRTSAVLYVLGATDCHSGNLIAHGDQLVLVDAETLLEPATRSDLRRDAAIDPSEDSGLAERCDDSILRCGLLPLWTFAGPGRIAFDMSALGVDSDGSPAEDHGWRNLNTDRMARHLVRRAAVLPTSSPVGPGRANQLARNLEPFCAGFGDQSRALVNRRAAWLAPGGTLDGFRSLPRRRVLRATRIYGAAQARQLQPEALRSELDQALRLESLARLYLTAPEPPRDWAAVRLERRQMRRLDIPYFSHPVDAVDLPLPGEDAAVPDCFETSGLEACRRRLAALDDAEIAFQLRLVRGAVEAKALRARRPSVTRRSALNPEAAFDRLGAAQAIAGMLVRGAEDSAGWLGFDLAEDGVRYGYGPLGGSLYSGTLGIAVFFSCLSGALAARGQEDAQGLGDRARRLLGPLERLTGSAEPDRLRRWWRDQPLGLAGGAGRLLGLIVLDAIGGAAGRGARVLARQLVEGLDDGRVDEASAPDLMGGGAGLIGPLLDLATLRSLALARRIGERLLDTLPLLAPGTPCGFSNGAGGLAAAFARLSRQTGTAAFERAAMTVFPAERGHGAPRPPDLGGSWCDGAAGGAIGALCLKRAGLWDPDLARNCHMALQAATSVRASEPFLCCGTLGRASVLRTAADALEEPAWRIRAEQLEAGVLRDLRALDLQQLCLDRPGLMMGASGLGLGLLDDVGSRRALKTLLSAGLLGPA